MACKHWKDDWVAHLYGELEVAEQSKLVEHVAGCSDCRQTLDGLAASRRMLQESAPWVPAAPRVVMVQPRRSWQPGWAFATGVACALLVFVVGVLVAPGLLPKGDVVPSDSTAGLLTRADLERALQRQQEQFEVRLATYEEQVTPSSTVPASWLTRDQLDDEMTRFRNEVRYDQARDFRILLGEITATEVRTANWIDENRDVLRYALRNRPEVGEH
jgi:hypothetical protein